MIDEQRWSDRPGTSKCTGEEALRESEEKYRLLIENSHDIIDKAQEKEWLLRSMINAFAIFQSVFDEHERFISYRFEYINDAYEQITGVKLEGVRGKTVQEVWPETEASWIEQYGAVAESGISRSFDMYHKPTAKLYHCNVYRPWDTAERFCVIFNDITDRKRAEEALRESEERFKRISMVISDFAYSCHKPAHDRYQIDWMTDAVEWITGYSVKEVIDRKCWGFIVLPEDLPLFERNVTGLVPGQSSRCELRIRHKSGEVRWLQTSTECLVDPQDPSCHRIFGGCVDITDRKRTEEALRESEGRFRSLFENSTIGLYRTTPNGEILLANPTLCQMLGFTTFEDLAHRNLEEEGFEPGVPRQVFRQALEEIGEIRALESAWKRKDGTFIFVRESARAVRDSKGSILYFEGTVEDITERKKSEEALRTAETNYRSLFERVPCGLYRSTLEGRFLEVNPALAGLFGYSSVQEMMTLDIARAFYHCAEERNQWVEKLLQAGELRNTESQALRKDGSSMVLLENSRVVRDESGRVLFFEGTLTDTTDRKRAEEALRESEVLQRILLDNLPAGVVIVDPVTRVIERVNDHVASLFGAPVEHLVGQRCHLLLCPTCEGACPVCDMGQDVDNSDRVMLRMDGSRLPILKTVKRIQMNGQEKLLECFVDVSDRKRAEEELRIAKVVVENSPTVVFRWSPEPGWPVEYATENVTIFGYQQEELVRNHTPFATMVHSDDQERISREIDQHLLRGDDFFWLEYRLVSPMGEAHWVDDHTTVIRDATGKVLHYQGTVTDTSERKKLEAEVERVRMDLLFAVSHDLKSPLQTLRQTQEMLNELPPAEALARFQEYSEIWRRNLLRLELMINNLLDSQRTEEGRFPLSTAVVISTESTIENVTPAQICTQGILSPKGEYRSCYARRTPCRLRSCTNKG